MHIDTPIIRLPELIKLVCLCKGSIYRGIKIGEFPGASETDSTSCRLAARGRIEMDRFTSEGGAVNPGVLYEDEEI